LYGLPGLLISFLERTENKKIKMKKGISHKDSILTIISVIILFFTAMIDWNIYSWLILVAIILLLIAWHTKN